MIAVQLDGSLNLYYTVRLFENLKRRLWELVMSIDLLKQEAFSKAFIRAIAARAGVSVTQPESDFGTDLTLTEIKARKEPNGDTSYVDLNSLRLQLKSTINLETKNNEVIFDLEVKNYNDLVDAESNVPRILVVVHVPREQTNWFTHNDDELILRHKAYWMSIAGRAPSDNDTKQRIKIPTLNVFNEPAINQLFAKIREEGRV